MKKYWMKKIPFVILIATTAFFVLSGIVMLLWNGILPIVLHVSTITFFQAMGILVLSKLLFGGFRGRRNRGGGHHWKMHMWNKWAGMTQEEKEKFKEQWHCYKGHWQMPVDAEGLYNCKKTA
jgi:hypothetical protein